MKWRTYAAQRARQAAQLAQRVAERDPDDVLEVFVRGDLVVAVAASSERSRQLFRDRTAKHVGSFTADASPFQIFGRILEIRRD